jgi:phage baseplate assembly protein W
MSILTSASDVRGRILASGAIELTWFHPDDLVAQGIVFDVYASDDPTDLFRTTCATAVAALVTTVTATNLAGDRYFTVLARRGDTLARPARALFLAVPAPRLALPGAPLAEARTPATGLGFPFGITLAGGVFAQGGEELLRGKILQLLLTSPGERVNRPGYGTRLLDLVFDPNSEVLAATMEFTITRALQQQFDDEIQVDTVQLTATTDTLLVDIAYVRKADLKPEQVRLGIPLPDGSGS